MVKIQIPKQATYKFSVIWHKFAQMKNELAINSENDAIRNKQINDKFDHLTDSHIELDKKSTFISEKVSSVQLIAAQTSSELKKIEESFKTETAWLRERMNESGKGSASVGQLLEKGFSEFRGTIEAMREEISERVNKIDFGYSGFTSQLNSLKATIENDVASFRSSYQENNASILKLNEYTKLTFGELSKRIDEL